jgi:hypothetical protein
MRILEGINSAAFITISSPDLKGENNGPVIALMGADLPRITGGYGGWNVVDRPRKRGAVEWEGPEPLRMELEIVLDAWDYAYPLNNIHDDLLAIERMASPVGVNLPPPTVHVSGKVIPRTTAVPWVIENIVWGTAINGTQKQVLRQTAKITFLQADLLEHQRELSPTKARAPRPPGLASRKPYKWKQGDTWPRVAHKLMPKVKYAARKIQKFNGFRPGMKMKVGQLVRIPPDNYK